MIVNFQGLLPVILLTVVWAVGNNPSSQLKFPVEFIFPLLLLPTGLTEPGMTQVKLWLTFNEPLTVMEGYSSDKLFAPAINLPGLGDYLAAHTVIYAHARVYRLYDQLFRNKQQGKIGIAVNINWCEPVTNCTQDVAACERYQQFNLGTYAHPIFSVEGDYPTVVKERIARNSAAEGYSVSRLPLFTPQQVEYIRGTADFLGLNFYTAYYGKAGEEGDSPSMFRDTGVVTTQDPGWVSSATSWLKSYLTEMLKAIHQDGCNVTGYVAWSLMYNFEWSGGYTEMFGLFAVDFDDPALPRTPKESAKVLAEIIRTRQIPERFRED